MSKKITLDNLKAFLEELDGRYVYAKSGYGLSSNDFEDEYKDRIKGVEDGAEKNRIAAIYVNDVPVAPNKNRVASIHLPECTKEDLDDVLDLSIDLDDDDDQYASEKDIDAMFDDGKKEAPKA